MKEKEKLGRILELIGRTWKEVDSGFHPEIDEEIKLINIVQALKIKSFPEAVQTLRTFLEELIAMEPKEYREAKMAEFERILSE